MFQWTTRSLQRPNPGAIAPPPHPPTPIPVPLRPFLSLIFIGGLNIFVCVDPISIVYITYFRLRVKIPR